MAFNIKKKQPAPDTGNNDDSDIIDELPPDDSEQTGNDGESDNLDFPEDWGIDESTIGKSNVVATQSWVFRLVRTLWNWTKFFATKALRVAGPIHAQRVKTVELEADNAFASRFTLLDSDGRPALLYIKNGKLQVDYDYRNAFIYPCGLPGNSNIEVRKFIYRFPDVASNFFGLTPYETLLNFVPYESQEYREYNEKKCYKLCPASGDDKVVDQTLLVTCNQLKKIVGVKILDENGNMHKIKLLPDTGTYRKLTINMPCFKSTTNEETAYVTLPKNAILSGPTNSAQQTQHFLPPFLNPPGCPFMPPPGNPMNMQQLQNDLFSDVDYETNPFDDLGEQDEQQEVQEETIQPGYEVRYQDYSTNTYCNLTLKENDFEPNKEQFLVIMTQDA